MAVTTGEKTVAGVALTNEEAMSELRRPCWKVYLESSQSHVKLHCKRGGYISPSGIKARLHAHLAENLQRPCSRCSAPRWSSYS